MHGLLSPVVLVILLLARCVPAQPGTADELEALIQAAGPGGTVQIDRVFVVCRRIEPLEDQTWEGSGTIERCLLPVTYLTGDASAGDETIQVANTQGFEARQAIGLGLGPRESGETCTAHWFQSSTATSLSFSNGLCSSYPAGTLVYANFPLLSIEVENVTLRGFTLDGHTSWQPDYHAWGSMNANLAALRAHHLLVEDVSVVNSWGDGIVLLSSDDVTLRGVRIENVRCGGAHWGGVTDLVVEDSTIRTTGTHAAQCGHSQGGLTTSTNNWDVTIRDSCFEDIQATWAAVGSMNMNTNAEMLLKRNTICGAPYFFSAKYSTSHGSPVFPVGRVKAYDNEAYVSDELFRQTVDGVEGDPYDWPNLIDFTESRNVKLGMPCSCP